MHVLRVVRVLLAVVLAVVVVAAGSSVLSARPDLERARHDVDTSWATLSGRLDRRYVLLAAVDDKIRPIPGPVRTLVSDVDTALARWRDVRSRSSVAAQVDAANDLEALARRLVATATASPRVRGNEAVLPALGQFLADPSRGAAQDFNRHVASYEHERSGPVRAVVASMLGDAEIPVLDTTAIPSATASS